MRPEIYADADDRDRDSGGFRGYLASLQRCFDDKLDRHEERRRRLAQLPAGQRRDMEQRTLDAEADMLRDQHAILDRILTRMKGGR